MLLEEFEVITGIYPDMELYDEINRVYGESNLDKHVFCKNYMENKDGMAEAIAYKVSVNKIIEDQKKERENNEMIELLKRQIKRLNEKLESEQEWKPWSSDKTVSQKEYDHLRNCGKVMNDDEAKKWIADEFGFSTSKISINRQMNTFEINRHSIVRVVGSIDRSPCYEATDWYYVFFTVRGINYEASNGNLVQI